MSKEACMIVIDMGKNMSSQFSSAIEAAKLMVHQRLLFMKKSNLLGLICCGTEGTFNQLNSEAGENYVHISVVQGLEPANISLLDYLEGLMVNEENDADIIDALLVAMGMIHDVCGTKKYKIRIYIITNAACQANSDPEALNEIIGAINALDIHINILAINFEQDNNESIDIITETTSNKVKNEKL